MPVGSFPVRIKARDLIALKLVDLADIVVEPLAGHGPASHLCENNYAIVDGQDFRVFDGGVWHPVEEAAEGTFNSRLAGEALPVRVWTPV